MSDSERQELSPKKRRELNYIEERRRVTSIFPSGEVVPSENPDFLLQTECGIGIEVTELCRELPRAEAIRVMRVPAKAQELYNRLADPEPVDVGIAFSARTEGMSVESLVKSLCEYVHAHSRCDESGPMAKYPEGYAYIGIHRSSLPKQQWHGVQSFDTVLIPRNVLESRITKKNLRVPTYRIAAPTVWLLIVADKFLGPGGLFGRQEDLAEWKFEFDFEQVLLFLREPGGGEVIVISRA